MNWPLTGVILAGGKGSRLAGLYPDTPKPLVPVCGHPFLHWIVIWAKQQGVHDFVFSIGHHANQIESWLQMTPLLTTEEHCVTSETDPLGTGGGVRACLPFCKDNILVTNGDSLIITPLLDVIKKFLADSDCDGLIVGKSMPDTSRYASLAINAQGRLAGYREKIPGSGLISTGVYLFRKSLLEAFPVGVNLSMEYDIIPRLLSDGARIEIHRVPDNTPFIDIGTPETVALATSFISDNFKNSEIRLKSDH